MTLELSCEGGGRDSAKERPKGHPSHCESGQRFRVLATTGPGHTKAVTRGLLLLEGPHCYFLPGISVCLPIFFFYPQPQSDCGDVDMTERFYKFRIK